MMRHYIDTLCRMWSCAIKIIAGGLIGFTTFYLLLSLGVLYTVDEAKEHLNKMPEFLGIGLTTLIGAWAGGAAAFMAERRTRDIKEKIGQITAANKAIFKLEQMRIVLQNLREHFIDKNGARNAEDRAFTMNSPQPGMVQAIAFDFNELGFLLGRGGEVGAKALMDLMLLELQFQVVRQTIEHRAEALKELHERMRKRPVGNNAQLGIQGLKVFYGVVYTKTEALTDQFATAVDEGLRQINQQKAELQIALQHIFPKEKFLQI